MNLILTYDHDSFLALYNRGYYWLTTFKVSLLLLTLYKLGLCVSMCAMMHGLIHWYLGQGVWIDTVFTLESGLLTITQYLYLVHRTRPESQGSMSKETLESLLIQKTDGMHEGACYAQQFSELLQRVKSATRLSLAQAAELAGSNMIT